MKQYIDAMALEEFAHNHIGGMIDVNDIARFPREEAEPIRHGHWVVETIFGMDVVKCSECGKRALGTVDMNDVFTPELTPACPFCSARMDGADLHITSDSQHHICKDAETCVVDDLYTENATVFKKKRKE